MRYSGRVFKVAAHRGNRVVMPTVKKTRAAVRCPTGVTHLTLGEPSSVCVALEDQRRVGAAKAKAI